MYAALEITQRRHVIWPAEGVKFSVDTIKISSQNLILSLGQIKVALHFAVHLEFYKHTAITLHGIMIFYSFMIKSRSLQEIYKSIIDSIDFLNRELSICINSSENYNFVFTLCSQGNGRWHRYCVSWSFRVYYWANLPTYYVTWWIKDCIPCGTLICCHQSLPRQPVDAKLYNSLQTTHFTN